MAVFTIDRTSKWTGLDGRWALYGSGMSTLNPQARIRGFNAPALNTVDRDAILTAYLAERNGTSLRVEPPASITGESWTFTADYSVAAANDQVGLVDIPPSTGYSPCFSSVLYPYNTVTQEYGPPVVMGKIEILYVDKDLQPVQYQTWRAGDRMMAVGFNLLWRDSGYDSGIYRVAKCDVYARDTSNNTLYRLKVDDFTFMDNATGINQTGVLFSLRQQNNTALPAAGGGTAYEIHFSSGTNKYGVCSIGNRTIYPATTETFNFLDATQAVTYSRQVGGPTYTLSPASGIAANDPFASANNEQALVAILMEAYERYYADQTKRVRVVIPPGRYYLNRRIPVPPGVILDLGTAEIVINTNKAYSGRPVASGSHLDNNAYMPQGIANTWRTAIGFPDPAACLFYLMKGLTANGPGGEVWGGKLPNVIDRMPVNRPLTIFYLQESAAPMTATNQAVKGVSIELDWAKEDASTDFTVFDTVVDYPTLSSIGSGASNFLIENVRGRAYAWFFRQGTRIRNAVIQHSDFDSPSGTSSDDGIGRLNGPNIFMRSCRWRHLHRGPQFDHLGLCADNFTMYDCEVREGGDGTYGSEQIMAHNQIDYFAATEWTSSVGGNPAVVRMPLRLNRAGPHIGYFKPGMKVMVVEGPGTGQIRTIVSAVDSGVNDGNNMDLYDITLNAAFTGSPAVSSASSAVIVGPVIENMTFMHNRFIDTGRGVMLFGATVNTRVIFNTFRHVGMAIWVHGRAHPTGMDSIHFDTTLQSNLYYNCDVALLGEVYRGSRTNTQRFLTNLNIHSERNAGLAPYVFAYNADSTAQTGTGPSANGITFANNSFDTLGYGGSLENWGVASRQWLPIRRYVDSYPVQFVSTTNWENVVMRKNSLLGWNQTEGLSEALLMGSRNGSGFPVGLPARGSLVGDLKLLQDLTSDANSFQSQINSLSSSISTLQTSVTTNTTNIGTLQSSVSTLQSTVTSQGTTLTTATGNITTLQTTTSGHASTLSSHGTRLTALESSVSALSTLPGRMDTIESSVATLSSNVTSLGSQVATNNGSVSALSATVANHTSTLAVVTGDLASLTTSVSTLNSSSSTQAGQISALQASVSGLDSGLTSVENTLALTETRVNILEGDVADIRSSCCGQSGPVSQLLPFAVILQNPSSDRRYFAYLPPRGLWMEPQETVGFDGNFYNYLARDRGMGAVDKFIEDLQAGRLVILQTVQPDADIPIPPNLLPPAE